MSCQHKLHCALQGGSNHVGAEKLIQQFSLKPYSAAAVDLYVLGHTFQSHPLSPLNATAAVLWSNLEGDLRAGVRIQGLMP